MKYAIVVQARMESKRLPGKSLYTIMGKTILEYVIGRCLLCKKVENIIVATSDNKSDDQIEELCKQRGIICFRGSEDNVALRLNSAASTYNIKNVVRVTADNPLVGFDVIDYLVDLHEIQGNDFTSNYHSKSFPNGTVVSIIEKQVLNFIKFNANDKFTKEHVVTNIDIIKDRFKIGLIDAPQYWNRVDIRFCLDYKEDFEVIEHIIKYFNHLNINPSTEQIIKFLDNNDSIKKINETHSRKLY